MIRRITTLVVAALFMLALAVPAFAASPSQTQCEGSGGTFSSQNGTKTCTTTTEGKNTKFTDTNVTSGQGNTGNKTQTSDTCGGTGSAKCPPGQF
jgi:hypothetical protein